MEWLEEFWQNGGVALIVFLVLGAILSRVIYNDPDRKARRLRRWRGKLMEEARRAYLLSRVADHVTDGLCDDWWASRMSDTEVNGLYTEIGSKLGIKDLLPRNGRRSLALLKHQIKHRLNSDRYYFDREGHRINVVVFPDCPGWGIHFQCPGGEHGKG